MSDKAENLTDSVTLYEGDAMATLAAMPDNSIDSIVTDPPYGLKFMGQKWDYDVPKTELWAEALRVLKPGGHLLAFAGTRTQHRMAVRIEDAGFEIRDLVLWVYGSGFPKSLDVSKALDKSAGAVREVVGRAVYGGGHVQNSAESIGYGGSDPLADVRNITAPATDHARQWNGWGTALKPACEPITLARKPLAGTVVQTVTEWGTGALNIDGCRIELNGDYKSKPNGRPSQTGLGDNYDPAKANIADTVGRWPANFIHDGSEEVLAGFPWLHGAGRARSADDGSHSGNVGMFGVGGPAMRFGGSGSAARFFYCAKANDEERAGGSHPTVKPLALMRYLVRLVTLPGGKVLDMYGGTGTTAVAAMHEGFSCVLVEREAKYCEIIRRRIAKAGGTEPGSLFAGLAGSGEAGSPAVDLFSSTGSEQ